MMEFNAIINGKEVVTSNKVEIISPWTLKKIGTVSALNQSDIDLAFKSSKNAQINWKNIVLLERIKILNKWLDLIINNKSKLAKIMVEEIAKSYDDCIVEVDRTIDYFKYTMEESKRMHPKSFNANAWGNKNKIGIFEYVPKGVILAISPFNYPVNLSISKIIPALVTGNSVVFKPATNGSLSALFFSKLSIEAKLPAGIFNVVTGRGRDIGDYLVQNESINLISFTGSAAVGNRLKKFGKELVLELGGKDPALVLEDYNLEKVANQIVSGAFSYSGQRCTAIKRVITTNKIADKLIPLLKKITNKLLINNKKNGVINPLIDIKSSDYVMELINDALTKKAKLIMGNKRDKNLIWPTIIDKVTVDMKLAWEEPFGPILPIIRSDDYSEMIEIVNKSNFGLQASIFTSDINQAFSIAKKLDVGTVNINGKSQRGPDSFPFLGVKDSGSGVQGIRNSLLSSVRIKGLVINYYD